MLPIAPWLLDVLSFVMIALGGGLIFARWQHRQTARLLEEARLRIAILEEQRRTPIDPELGVDMRLAQLEDQMDRLAEGQEFLSRILTDRLALPGERPPQRTETTPH